MEKDAKQQKKGEKAAAASTIYATKQNWLDTISKDNWDEEEAGVVVIKFSTMYYDGYKAQKIKMLLFLTQKNMVVELQSLFKVQWKYFQGEYF